MEKEEISKIDKWSLLFVANLLYEAGERKSGADFSDFTVKLRKKFAEYATEVKREMFTKEELYFLIAICEENLQEVMKLSQEGKEKVRILQQKLTELTNLLEEKGK